MGVITSNIASKELPKKGGLDNLQGGLAKKREEGVFRGGEGG